MRLFDLIRMSAGNLWRRKIRTILTILGVIIGTASIVVMVSIGIGQNRALLKMIEESGSLTAIQVFYYGSGATTFVISEGGSFASGVGSDTEEVRLNDEMLETFASMEHVSSVVPRLTFTVVMKQGVFINEYVQLIGVPQSELQKITLKEGTLPAKDSEELEFVVGNMAIVDFMNEKTQENYWSTRILPDVDLMNRPVFTIYDQDAYYNSQYGDGEMPKKYLLQASGIVEGEIEEWNEYSYGMYCDIDVLKATLKKVFRNKPIPRQPLQKNGKPYADFTYEEVVVNVEKMDDVEVVLKQIQDMGFEAYSNAEYLASMQEQSQTTQMVLGGIGGVSLFVAAIGIANTMMMSIYERTKEIGIIKVLGCALGNIRTMFLLEAAFIGFLGGLIGVGFSYFVSYLVNRFAGNLVQNNYGEATEGISYIPIWLALAGIGFSVLVGVVSGFLPALRAMKLSPLAAIRNE